ncbi:hypothetical protein ACIQJT_41440 [Streptomyces sp. NPDC091972]|uniref:hypothetical protein n=1 Tax=Streptomyces sp. NPDC091972 TaxID=3366007 RepID=UPI003823846B
MSDRSQYKELKLTAASSRIPFPSHASPTVFVAFADGSVDAIDTVAVEQAVRGHRSGWTLTPSEIQYAAPFMFDVVPYSVICSRLGISAKRLKALFPEVGPIHESAARPGSRSKGTAPKGTAPCGTRRGYSAHRRKGEDACARCKSANTAADRHYRTHGTYAGAPEFVELEVAA